MQDSTTFEAYQHTAQYDDIIEQQQNNHHHQTEDRHKFDAMQEPLEQNHERAESSTPPSSSVHSNVDSSSSLKSQSSDEQHETTAHKGLKPMKKQWSQDRFKEITSWKDVRESTICLVVLLASIILLMKYPILYSAL